MSLIASLTSIGDDAVRYGSRLLRNVVGRPEPIVQMARLTLQELFWRL